MPTKKQAKKSKPAMVSFTSRFTPDEVAELAKSAKAANRSIGAEVRFRLFPPQVAK